MKMKTVAGLGLGWIFLGVGFSVAQDDQGKEATQDNRVVSVAVIDFESKGGAMKGKGAEAAIFVDAALSTGEGFLMVERQELGKILGEQELGLSGTVDASSAAKIGHLTGAKVLVTGRIFRSGSQWFLAGKTMSTETGRVFSAVEKFGKEGKLSEAGERLGTKLKELILTNREKILAPEETVEDKKAKFAEVLKGKKLPSVSVEITEQHLNNEVIDPAAETEMRKVLAELGFEVIDSKESGKRADIRVKGEGFSERGGNVQGLVSCKARVEIKVTRDKDGELLLSDRQTEVAVDTAEHVAGKTALQKAALKLLDRMIEVLAEG